MPHTNMLGLHCPELKSSIPIPFVVVKAGLRASSWWEMAPSEAAFLLAFSAPGICDSGQGICLLTMSFSSFTGGKHSVYWVLWLSWLVPLAPVQWLLLFVAVLSWGWARREMAAHLEYPPTPPHPRPPPPPCAPLVSFPNAGWFCWFSSTQAGPSESRGTGLRTKMLLDSFEITEVSSSPDSGGSRL